MDKNSLIIGDYYWVQLYDTDVEQDKWSIAIWRDGYFDTALFNQDWYYGGREPIRWVRIPTGGELWVKESNE